MRVVLAKHRASRRKKSEPEPTNRPELAARWLEPGANGGTRRDDAQARLLGRRKGTATPVNDEERDLRGIVLPAADLSGLDLSEFDLSKADLSGANLSRSRLIRATLRGTILVGADLTECEFLGADLTGAELSDCKSERASFGQAKLSDAIMFNAACKGSTFTKASLARADLRAADLSDTRLLEADLDHTDLTRAVLRGADLSTSKVSGARFVEADLRGARLRGVSGHDTANWVGADILGVDFCGAYLARRTIEDQNYLHEFRAGSRLNNYLYWVWWATSDCGRSFLRWGLWTVLLAGIFAGLHEMVAVDYGDYPTFLSSFYYSVVTLTTLGYGDVVPASPAAQLISILEVGIGYVMLGGLLSIFSNKMARRAD